MHILKCGFVTIAAASAFTVEKVPVGQQSVFVGRESVV